MIGVPDYDVSLPRRERWAVLRDFVENREQLTAAECRMLFALGMSDPDRNVGTAVMCGVLYRRACPADVREVARGCDRAAVRRVGNVVASRASDGTGSTSPAS